MKNLIKIKRTDFGLSYQVNNNGQFRHFSDGVKTYQDIIRYFTEGKHIVNGSGQYDQPSLQFVDNNNRPIKIYQVRRTGDYYSAYIDLDNSRRLMFTDDDLYPIDDRRRFFSEDDVNIPNTSEKDLLEYAEDNYPGLVDLYKRIYAEKTDKHAISSFIQSHSNKYFKQIAAVEFE